MQWNIGALPTLSYRGIGPASHGPRAPGHRPQYHRMTTQHIPVNGYPTEGTTLSIPPSGYNPYTAGNDSPRRKSAFLLWSIPTLIACVCMAVIYHNNRAQPCEALNDFDGVTAEVTYSIVPPFVECTVYGPDIPFDNA